MIKPRFALPVTTPPFTFSDDSFYHESLHGGPGTGTIVGMLSSHAMPDYG